MIVEIDTPLTGADLSKAGRWLRENSKPFDGNMFHAYLEKAVEDDLMAATDISTITQYKTADPENPIVKGTVPSIWGVTFYKTERSNFPEPTDKDYVVISPSAFGEGKFTTIFKGAE